MGDQDAAVSVRRAGRGRRRARSCSGEVLIGWPILDGHRGTHRCAVVPGPRDAATTRQVERSTTNARKMSPYRSQVAEVPIANRRAVIAAWRAGSSSVAALRDRARPALASARRAGQPTATTSSSRGDRRFRQQAASRALPPDPRPAVRRAAARRSASTWPRLQLLLGAIPAGAIVVCCAPPGADPAAEITAAARRRSRRAHRVIVYVSSTGVYGPGHGAWVDETWPIAPRTGAGRARQRQPKPRSATASIARTCRCGSPASTGPVAASSIASALAPIAWSATARAFPRQPDPRRRSRSKRSSPPPVLRGVTGAINIAVDDDPVADRHGRRCARRAACVRTAAVGSPRVSSRRYGAPVLPACGRSPAC